jgi:hypothetical protein
MLKKNEMIELSGGEAIAVLKEIEYVMISLRKIASYYYDRTYAPPTDDTAIEYALETTRFIDQSGVMRRLSKARSIISNKFDNELGPDDMGDLEREMELLRFWEKPGD